ncbi:MAG TPA: type I-E CRISPR-associated protein Cse2/CasB [Pseudonocardiaceae bacterium]|nr:type I-E CRISPR-associated protein Cse2/CasB [Pseudonocardiaceae bacterium]
MTETAPTRRFYWQRHTDGQGGWRERGSPPGADLAALRCGIGREPGSVPQMWPYYTTLAADGEITPSLRAEHLALTLFAVHQQSLSRPVHREGVGLGTAVLALRNDKRNSPEAVDRRFSAAATATSLNELAHHVRGLITQICGLTSQPGLDYTRLFNDLRSWEWSQWRIKVRRRWGSQYFVWTSESSGQDAETAESPS